MGLRRIISGVGILGDNDSLVINALLRPRFIRVFSLHRYLQPLGRIFWQRKYPDSFIAFISPGYIVCNNTPLLVGRSRRRYHRFAFVDEILYLNDIPIA
jgi:hypothetical protein